MKYIDSHCHLQFEDYDKDREDEIKKTAEAQTAAIVVGVDVASSKQAIKLAEEHDFLFACAGIHPNHGDSNTDELESIFSHPKVVGVGECGLDFFRSDKIKDGAKQRKIFEKQIDSAVKHNKPLMIHARNAYKELAEILSAKKKEHGEKLRANMHFFAGDLEDAKAFLDLDFTLSFSGVITFARDYDEIVRYAPLSKILSETDAPYAAPIPFRGKRNNPRFVSEVVAALARIREEDEADVQKTVFENACRVFSLHLKYKA
ncbi:MAG TPA: TatD family hydrolase [Candidatus Paceibacterota bacterium]